jgi:DNA-binding beta-propeller fold protein YncE
MNLFILDQRNQRIRKIDTTGKITTVAGTGTLGFAGDDGNPLEAQVSFPPGSNPPPNGMLDFDAEGRLYFADTKNNRIRRIDFTANTIETVLGDGTPAALNNPRDVERGPDGRIYVADEGNNRILALTPADLSVEIIAGTGTVGDSGDFGPAKDAQLNHPTGVAFDAAGDLYIADNQNNRVRIVRMGGK